ncbi:MAG: helix-turn-helix transcriptional regulator [Phycisphaeraceae bacterium]|nr:helix-turn-helix transcriptional regulator [Phycisphaeraceae bacterium]
MPASRDSKPLLIDRPAATRALVSATRQEIVDALSSAGPCTVAKLADLLGRRPDALYFHVRALQRVGLVRQQPQPNNEKKVGVVYELPSSVVRLDYDAAPRADLVRVVRHALKLSLREFERECLAIRPVGAGGKRRLWGGRVMGWVTEQELARINSLIEELHSVLRKGRPGADRRAFSLGFLLAPSGFGERSRVSNESRKKSRRKG